VFAGRDRFEHHASDLDLAAPETIVSMPGIECAGYAESAPQSSCDGQRAAARLSIRVSSPVS